jgi:hypothetical protein
MSFHRSGATDLAHYYHSTPTCPGRLGSCDVVDVGSRPLCLVSDPAIAGERGLLVVALGYRPGTSVRQFATGMVTCEVPARTQRLVGTWRERPPAWVAPQRKRGHGGDSMTAIDVPKTHA